MSRVPGHPLRFGNCYRALGLTFKGAISLIKKEASTLRNKTKLTYLQSDRYCKKKNVFWGKGPHNSSPIISQEILGTRPVESLMRPLFDNEIDLVGDLELPSGPAFSQLLKLHHSYKLPVLYNNFPRFQCVYIKSQRMKSYLSKAIYLGIPLTIGPECNR